MDRDYDVQIIEDDLDRLVKQTFGIDEDQLLKDFLLAQTEIKDDQIPPEPEDGFEKLMEKMRERGIEPRYSGRKNITSHADGAAQEPATIRTRKPRRLKIMLKVALIAAILVAMVLGMGITARGRKRYAYQVTERDVVGKDVVYNKGDTWSEKDKLNAAYLQIQEELGIDVVRLTYIPNGMVFKEIIIGKNRSTMIFEYNGVPVCLIQQKKLEDSSFNLTSDKEVYGSVYNSFLEMDIPVGKNLTEDGKTEFHMRVGSQDSYISLEGIMKGDEFEQLVEGLCIFKR